MSPKLPTMSTQQGATASLTSYLILGLKEFIKVVESMTWPWSMLSCFETTPSIQVSKNRTEGWRLKNAKRLKVNVPEMKCLRSLLGVSQMDRVGNQGLRRRAEIEMELGLRVH